MKKLLTLLLTLLMIFTLVGCNSKEDTSIVQESEQQEVIEKIEEETELVGGYVDVEDGTLTDEFKDMFSKALEGLTGANYEPVELVATQVVAGTNYKFLANGTKTTNPVTKGTYYIIINEDLQGNVKLLDIETIEEKQEKTTEETKQEIDPEVLKTYKYWVVFFNPDGTELQREALKWGTTPEYYDGIPYYYDGSYDYDFVGWTNKKGQPKELKPITGNTYFYAKYEISTEKHHYSGGGGSQPSIPDHTQVECLTSTRYAYIDPIIYASDEMEFIFDAKMTKSNWCRCLGNWYGSFTSIVIQSYTGGFYIAYPGGNTTNGYSGNINTRLSYDAKFSTSSGSYLKCASSTFNFSYAATHNTEKIYIFSLNGALGDQNDQPFSMYFMKIYQDGSLVRDFIPVKTNKELNKAKNATDPSANIPADTLCFYDNVTNKYYLNSGSQPFTDTPIPD